MNELVEERRLYFDRLSTNGLIIPLFYVTAFYTMIT